MALVLLFPIAGGDATPDERLRISVAFGGVGLVGAGIIGLIVWNLERRK